MTEICVVIPENHQNAERAILSLAAQACPNWRCMIGGDANDVKLRATLGKLPRQDPKFQIVANIPEAASGEVRLCLNQSQWFAHSQALAQITEISRKYGHFTVPQLKWSQDSTATPFDVTARLADSDTGCVISPDLSLVTNIIPRSPGKLNLSGSAPCFLPRTQESCGKIAISTVVTPDYLPNALISLGSYMRNCRIPCDPYVLLASTDREAVSRIRETLKHSPFHVLAPDEIACQNNHAKGLARKYGLYTNEYRWGMKSALMHHLLESGYDTALHLDHDIYVLDDITDLQSRLGKYDISVFPHFRNPDIEAERKILYQDGFFNGGMLGATAAGLRHLRALSERCLKEMKRDRIRNLFDDQKYYDNFIFEVDNLFINKDRGINYASWNSEPVMGLIAPSQRSFLLGSGYFARIWHMHSDFIKGTIVEKQSRSAARIMVIWYLMIQMQTFLLLCMADRSLVSLFSERLNHLFISLAILIGTGEINQLNNLMADIVHGKTPKQEMLSRLFAMDMPAYDNYTLLSTFIEWLFPGESAKSQIISFFSQQDYRHLSEDSFQNINLNLDDVLSEHSKRANQVATYALG